MKRSARTLAKPVDDRPKVTSQPVLNADGALVGERQVVEGQVGQKFTVARERVKVMTESFTMIGSSGAELMAKAELSGLEYQLVWHILSTMEFGNELTLNVSAFRRSYGRSTGSAYKAVDRLVAAGVIDRIDAGPGRCSRFRVNPMIGWKGRDRRDRELATKLWESRRKKREGATSRQESLFEFADTA